LVRLISVPASSVQTRIVAASTKEAELGTQEEFERYVSMWKP